MSVANKSGKQRLAARELANKSGKQRLAAREPANKSGKHRLAARELANKSGKQRLAARELANKSGKQRLARAESFGDQFYGVADGEARGCEVHGTSRVGAHHQVGTCSVDGFGLAGANIKRQLTVDQRIRTAGTAAHSLIVKLYQLFNERFEDAANSQMRALHMTQMTWVLQQRPVRRSATLHRSPSAHQYGQRATRECRRPVPRRLELRRCRADGHSPSRPHRNQRSSQESLCHRRALRSLGQRARGRHRRGPRGCAARHSKGPRPRWAGPSCQSPRSLLGLRVNVALPGVHYAPGEQPHVVARCMQRPTADR